MSPRSSKRLCPRCKKVIQGKCPTCSVGWTTRPSSNWIPGTYSRALWDKTRRAYLRAHPLCEQEDCDELSQEVDHLDGCDYTVDRYNWDWLRALCTPHHRTRTANQGVAERRRRSTKGGASRSPDQT